MMLTFAKVTHTSMEIRFVALTLSRHVLSLSGRPLGVWGPKMPRKRRGKNVFEGVVVQTLLWNTDYCKSLAMGATPEEDFLEERLRLRAWFDSTKAQEAKARVNEKNKTGAAGRRPPTKFKEMRTAFLSEKAAVSKGRCYSGNPESQCRVHPGKCAEARRG